MDEQIRQRQEKLRVHLKFLESIAAGVPASGIDALKIDEGYLRGICSCLNISRRDLFTLERSFEGTVLKFHAGEYITSAIEWLKYVDIVRMKL